MEFFGLVPNHSDHILIGIRSICEKDRQFNGLIKLIEFVFVVRRELSIQWSRNAERFKLSVGATVEGNRRRRIVGRRTPMPLLSRSWAWKFRRLQPVGTHFFLAPSVPEAAPALPEQTRAFVGRRWRCRKARRQTFGNSDRRFEFAPQKLVDVPSVALTERVINETISRWVDHN